MRLYRAVGYITYVYQVISGGRIYYVGQEVIRLMRLYGAVGYIT